MDKAIGDPVWEKQKCELLAELEAKDAELVKLQAKIDKLTSDRSRGVQGGPAPSFRLDMSRISVETYQENIKLLREIQDQRIHRQNIELSMFWRVTSPSRKILRRLGVQLKAPDMKGIETVPLVEEAPWPAKGFPGLLSPRRERCLVDDAMKPPSNPVMPEPDKLSPTLSFIVAIQNPSETNLFEFVESVFSQTYPKWELCFYARGSSDENRALLGEIARTDSRVRVQFAEDGNDVHEPLQAVAKMATGDYVAAVKENDLLAPGALSAVVRALRENPNADLIYTDHAVIAADGTAIEAVLKRAWSPEFFLSVAYPAHLQVVRKSTFEKVGGYDGSPALFADGDLVMKLMEAEADFAYVPEIQYFERDSSGSGGQHLAIDEAAISAYNRYFERNHIPAKATYPPQLQMVTHRVQKLEFPFRPAKKAAIIVPLTDSGLDKKFMESIAKTEIDAMPEIHFVSLGQALQPPGPLTHHARNQAEFDAILTGIDAEAFVFVAGHARFVCPEWLSEVLGYLSVSPRIGAVGGKVLDRYLNVEASGVRLTAGLPTMYDRMPDAQPGYALDNHLATNVEAVSSLLMATPKSVYMEVGGLQVHAYGEAAGIAYGLKLKKAGYRTVLNPWSKIVNYKPVQQPHRLEESLRSEFPAELFKDRYYHPEFDGGQSSPNP